MSWLAEFLNKTAGAQGPASLSGAPPAGGIAPPMNPVQQIASQRAAAQSQSGTPIGNPEVMKAQQAASEAQQQAQQQAAQVEQTAAQQAQQLQQQMAEQQQQAQQQMAEQANKSFAENEQLKAQVRTEKAKAELAQIESAKGVAMAELQAKGKEIDSHKHVADQQLATQQAQVDQAPALAELGQRLSAVGSPAPAKPEAKPKPKTKAAAQAPPQLPTVLKPSGPIKPAPEPVAGAGWAQSLQRQGFNNPNGQIFRAATYRPSFGAIPDQILTSLLPAVYGQPEWSKFFGNSSQNSAFNPQQLAMGVGTDLARSFL